MSNNEIAKSEAMASKAKSKKRSLNDEGGSRKKRKAGFQQDESLLDTEAGVNQAIAAMDPQLLADYLAQKTSRFGSDLSPVELADLYISRLCPIPMLCQAVTDEKISHLYNGHHIVARSSKSREAARVS